MNHNNKWVTPADILSAIVNLNQLVIEVTDTCNLNCTYCGFGDMYAGYDARIGKNLNFEYVKILLDYLSQLWSTNMGRAQIPHTYISFYGGEPLMNMTLIKKTIQYIESKNVLRRFSFTMTTNATLLNKHIEYLVEKDFRLLISLDGDKSNNSYRITKNGLPSYETVLSNIRILMHKYPSYFKDNVNFNTVLHDRNSTDEIIPFMKSEFGKIPTISELNNSGIRLGKELDFSKIYRKRHDDISKSKYYHQLMKRQYLDDPDTKDLLMYIYNYSGNVFRDYNHLLAGDSSQAVRPTDTCIPFSRKLFLTVNGKLLPCEKIDHTFYYGTIDKKGIHLDMEKSAQLFNEYLTKMRDLCAKCFRHQSCNQCIYFIEKNTDSRLKCNALASKQDFLRFKSTCLELLVKNPTLYRRIMKKVRVD